MFAGFDEYIERVVQELNCDDIISGRVREYCRKFFQRHTRLLDLDKASTPGEREITRRIPPDVFGSMLVTAPETRDVVFNFLKSPRPFFGLLSLAIFAIFYKPEPLYVLGLIGVLVILLIKVKRVKSKITPRRVEQRFEEYLAVSSRIERLSFYGKMPFSEPCVIIGYKDSQERLSTLNPQTLYITSRLVKELHGKVPVDEKVKDYLKTQPLPLDKKLTNYKRTKCFHLLNCAILIFLLWLGLSYGGLYLFHLVPFLTIPFSVLLLALYSIKWQTGLIHNVVGFIACFFFIGSVGLLANGFDYVSLIFIGAALGSVVFCSWIPNLIVTPKPGIFLKPLIAGVVVALLIFYVTDTAVIKPTHLFSVEGDVLLSTIREKDTWHIATTTLKNAPEGNEGLQAINNLYRMNESKEIQKTATIPGYVVDRPVKLKDSDTVVFPFSEGAKTVRLVFVNTEHKGQRECTITLPYPAETFDLLKYQLSGDGEYILYQDNTPPSETLRIIKKVSTDKIVRRYSEPKPLMHGETTCVLGWYDTHSIALMKSLYIPGKKKEKSMRSDVRFLSYDLDTDTTTTLMSIPDDVYAFNYSPHRSAVAMLSTNDEIMVCHLEKDRIVRFDNGYEITPAQLRASVFPREADILYVFEMGATLLWEKKPKEMRCIRFDLAQQEQDLVIETTRAIFPAPGGLSRDGNRIVFLQGTEVFQRLGLSYSYYAFSGDSGERVRLCSWPLLQSFLGFLHYHKKEERAKDLFGKYVILPSVDVLPDSVVLPRKRILFSGKKKEITFYEYPVRDSQP